MIFESYYWKKDLINSVAWMKRNRHKLSFEDNNEQILAIKLEKRVLLCFYAIRKLIESKKVRTDLHDYPIEVTCYPNIQKTDHFNWHHLDGLR